MVSLLGFLSRAQLAPPSVPVGAGISSSLTPESPYGISRSPTPSLLYPPRPVGPTSRGLLISCSPVSVSALLIPTTASLWLTLACRWNRSNPVSASPEAQPYVCQFFLVGVSTPVRIDGYL